MRLAILLLRLVCYAALAFVLSGVALVVFVTQTGKCPRLDEGAVECVSPLYQSLGEYGLGILLVTAFGGVPALLALAGLGFLIRDAYRAIARKRAMPGAE